MRLLKTNVLLRLLNSYIVDSPQPANISYLWNFGSLLGACLIIQILTGVFLAMHYQPHVDFAFNSVEHIMRDVNAGWILRYTHANVASFFFIFVYAHIARGLYYSSYKSPRILVWSIGVIILILMMAIAFLGYEHSPTWFNNNFLILNSMVPCSTKIVDNFIKDKNLKPVYTYEKLESHETREKVCKEIKHISGIYMILNKVTLDYYIGSASTNRMYSRFIKHMIYLTGSKIVKLAIKKYNLSNFAFLVLEIFPEIVTQKNNKQLLDLEDFYLKSLLPNYNILTEAGNSFGYKHTEIIRINMKANYSLERRLQIGALNRGKTFSNEIIERMRNSALKRKPYTYSEEGKLNLQKKSKPLLVFNLNGTLYGEYNSLTEAATNLNCSLKTINRCLKTEKKLLKRQWILKLSN